MADRYRAMMGRRFGKPARQIFVRVHPEFHRRLGVANLHDRPVCRVAFAADQFQSSLVGLCKIQRRNRPFADFRFDGYAGALFAMIQAHTAQNRLALGNRTIEGSTD